MKNYKPASSLFERASRSRRSGESWQKAIKREAKEWREEYPNKKRYIRHKK
jgi:hypothetical protein